MQKGLTTLLILLLVVSLFTSANALKFLAWNPIQAHSHSNFQAKISDALVEAGHEVVMLSPILNIAMNNVTSKLARIILVPPDDFTKEYSQIVEGELSEDFWTTEQADPYLLVEPMRNLTPYYVEQCRLTLTSVGLLDSLRSENFDGGFGESLDPCGFGIFHLLGIKKVAVTQSMASIDESSITGVPAFPSFQPGIFSIYGDEMSFWERFYNIRAVHAAELTVGTLNEPLQELFEELFPGTPKLQEIIKNASYFFLNTEPLIDFPRLVTRKMIDIGGIALPTKWQPIQEPLSSEMSLRPHTVLISFGTFMLSHLMPEQFKQSIRSLALALPNVTFLWKYEKPEHNVAAGIPNLITHTWLPQTDLLRDPRLSAFITHGGAGSSYETVLTGIPSLVIPVMADQMRNGEMIRRIGTGKVLKRDDLADSAKLIQAVRDVLENEKYRERARTVAEMVESQPQSVRERLVSNMEFMARFGPLDQLSHAGRDMSTVIFYSIDVFSALIAGVVVVGLVIIVTVTKVFRFFFLVVVRIRQKRD